MKKISEAEFEIINVIWKKEKITSGEITKSLSWKKWNENTIRTLIKRLHQKGAIEIVDKKGKTYFYSAVLKEDEYKIDVFKEMLKKLYNNSMTDFIEECYRNKLLSKNDLKSFVL